MKIIKYDGVNDIDVEFENGFIKRNTTYTDFKRGSIDHNDYSKRLGETRINNYGSKITVINYINWRNVIVQFDNGYITKTSWNNFDKSNIKSPYCKTFLNVGYLGEGKYTCDDIWYNYWRAMIERVNIKDNKFHRTYADVTIWDDWYNYQNFAEWAESNYYTINNYKMELDKDILVKGNRIYSPDTCVFVPDIINSLLIKADKARGDFPIGVYWHGRDEEYRAQCSYITDYGQRKNKWLGGYDNPQDAFEAYKIYKEEYIKKLANKFKKDIPEKLYNALYNYEVEITD